MLVKEVPGNRYAANLLIMISRHDPSENNVTDAILMGLITPVK